MHIRCPWFIRLLFLASLLATLPGRVQAGSAGIRNGGIQGVVYDDFNKPLVGVNVVAVRQVSPQVIRSTFSDAMGNFFLPNMPLGEYILGFAKFGYKTIDTMSGTPQQATAVGSQVRVYVDSGQVAIAPSVNLQNLPDTSNGTVNAKVLDLVDGTPVTGATVTLGPVAATSGSPDGTYVLSAPASVDEKGNPAPATLNVLADGYQPFSGPVTVVPKTTQNLTFRVNPSQGEANGIIRAPGVPPDLSQVAIVVPNVDASVTQGRVTPNGSFSFRLPASNANITRRYNVLFVLTGYQTATVPVVAPRAGAITVMPDVILTAQQVEVAGQVLLSNGQPAPSGQVILVELGRAATISGGNYTIQCPVGRPLTLNFTAQNPTTNRQESGQTTVTPVSDGSPNPVYNVPPVQIQ